jgi:hypothetical protein
VKPRALAHLTTVERRYYWRYHPGNAVRTEDRGRTAELADQRALRRSAEGLHALLRQAPSGEDLAREVRDAWAGEPYVNIQNKNGQAKPYQVKQVLAAIDKLEGKG